MKRLMIVDDEAVITTQLEDRLQSMKYDVVGTASSAEESVSMARDLYPDLILMDIVMKGKLDGIEAAEIISDEMDVPVIFITGYTSDNYLERAKKVMPFGYIMKPFRENDIRANIEIALHRKDLERRQRLLGERIRRLCLVIEYNPYIIVLLDIEGNIDFVNNKFSQIIGYEPNEIVGKDISSLQPDEKVSKLYDEMRGEIISGEEWRGELPLRRKDGTSDLEYMVAMPVKDINGDIVSTVLILENAAKRKKRENLLLKSNSLNIMRTITAGVAHEFNNILAVISGSAELLEEGYKDKNELDEGLRNIITASEKGAGMVRGMITIVKSDKDTSRHIFFDLRQLIIQSIDSTIPGWKDAAWPEEKKYEIDRDGMERIPEVFCNPTELKEVFINIINNALDAMPDGGTISLGTWNNEDTVFVKVSDTGMGMSENVKNRIFDPFFTTRRPQRTGLGMGVAYSIITKHGGKIDVVSEEGEGTMLTMSLPIKNKIEQQKI